MILSDKSLWNPSRLKFLTLLLKHCPLQLLLLCHLIVVRSWMDCIFAHLLTLLLILLILLLNSSLSRILETVIR